MRVAARYECAGVTPKGTWRRHEKDGLSTSLPSCPESRLFFALSMFSLSLFHLLVRNSTPCPNGTGRYINLAGFFSLIETSPSILLAATDLQRIIGWV